MPLTVASVYLLMMIQSSFQDQAWPKKCGECRSYMLLVDSEIILSLFHLLTSVPY